MAVLTLFAAASLCGFVAVLAAGARSHFIADEVEWVRPVGADPSTAYRTIRLTSSRGVFLAHVRLREPWASAKRPPASFRWLPRRPAAYPQAPPSALIKLPRLRFAYHSTSHERLVVTPYWLPALLLLALPLLWLTKSLALAKLRGRVRRGICPDCRYDLRASTGRCPECGREIGMGTLAARKAERVTRWVLPASPLLTLGVLALLGVFSRPRPPAAPSGLVAVRADDLVRDRRFTRYESPWSIIRLEWADRSSNETGFTIERRFDGRSWTRFGETNQAVAYDHLPPRTAFEYRVFAKNDFGSSGPSNVARFSAEADEGSPNAPRRTAP